MKSPKAFPTMLLITVFAAGCAAIRVTDPPRSATEQFLVSQAIRTSLTNLDFSRLRDRTVFIETTYLTPSWATDQDRAFFMGEVRARMLSEGVRLVQKVEDSEIVLEIRSGGLGIDRLEYLLGIPAFNVGAVVTPGATITTPELAIVKSTRQFGIAQASYVAYWQESGELVMQSGPFEGRTFREDWWFFGVGPQTTGNIPPVERGN